MLMAVADIILGSNIERPRVDVAATSGMRLEPLVRCSRQIEMEPDDGRVRA